MRYINIIIYVYRTLKLGSDEALYYIILKHCYRYKFSDAFKSKLISIY